MKVGGRRTTLFVFCSFLSVGLAGLAWACTPQAQLTLIPPGPVPAGSPVKVTGEGFAPGRPVEIRWNSPSGAVLATAQGPSFSTTIKVPSDAAGNVYYVMAQQIDVPGPLGITYPTFGGSAPLGVAAQNIAPAANSTDAEAASQFGVSPDLWTGFEKGRSPEASGGASPEGTAASSQAPAAIGLGLFAVGIAGVVAVGVIPLANKRRMARFYG